ncbi:uncharacterized protein LOC131025718 [Salvia miltiorrhiza]|uniref:uncharacterized protein LOC131025718 n=1 Tax=Salvia miltiorrhiza TaxID=226208 RepID=UPI0025AD4B21|nr:uncharacterized protein LOC131025718 [Salvia miltiorrhiza]
MQQPQQQNYRPPHQRTGYQALKTQQHTPEKQGKSLEEMMADLIGNQQFLQGNVQQLQQSQAEQKVQIEGLARQMSQLATSMNQLRENNGALPSQVYVNPKENVNKITLRSGTELNGPTFQGSQGSPRADSGVDSCEEQFENSVDTIDSIIQPAEQSGLAKQNRGSAVKQKKKEAEVESTKEEQTKVSKSSSLYDPKVAISVPFPGRLARKKPEEELIDFVKIFGKLEVNLPFLQALKIPPYGKFVKDFIAGKSKATGKIVMGENVSAAIKKELPAKCKDPSMFSLPIYIGDTRIEHAMCDLGASINVMPLTVSNSFSGVELVDTRVVIQLADRSCVHPEGLLKNVLVSVNNFVYPADFYVVRMSGVQSQGSSGVLLGRPFLRTAKSIIDVSNGTICLDYHGEKYTFSIDDAMNPLVQELLETEFMQDKLELAMMKSWIDFDAQGMDDAEIKEAIMSLYAQPELVSSGSQFYLPKQTPSDRPLRSDEKPLELELKPLPATLKHVYLGESETLPVIISSELTATQEEQLIVVLRRHKKAIGWTLADITGISPDVCQHYILLEEDAKPVRDSQRKLNPNMREIVLKEILKLLALGIIYPISDSKWVSPIHMVPKKSGLQVVENEKNELVPMRLVTGWRMCIDYRKLNAATRKDHFPLPFIDQCHSQGSLP